MTTEGISQFSSYEFVYYILDADGNLLASESCESPPSLLDTFQSYKMTMREVNMSKKRYPDEFKIEAVKQVVDAGHSVADVAGRLGMTTHSLYAWISKFGPDSSEHIAKSDDQAEIRRLKKELKRTTEERDLLKKAAVYFANQSE